VFAGHLNFTRAAEELHISQPALHVKVQKLSAGIGSALYVKDGRTLQLTDVGRSVAALWMDLDSRLDDFFGAIGQPPEAALVLAAGAGAHRWVTQDAVRLLIQRGTKLRLLSTNRDETIEAVGDGRADVGVTVLPSRPTGIGSVELARYPQVVIVPTDHRLARARALRLGDLEGEDLVMPPEGRPQRRALDRAIRGRGVKIDVAAEAEGWSQMLDFVRLGVGICIVNGCVAPTAGTVSRPIEDLPEVTYSALFRSSARHEVAVVRLLQALEASVP
jgi:DNA-binding transcriptional LysR family regulator